MAVTRAPIVGDPRPRHRAWVRTVAGAAVLALLVACASGVALWTNPGASWATAFEDLYNGEGGSTSGFGTGVVEVWGPFAAIVALVVVLGMALAFVRPWLSRRDDARRGAIVGRLVGSATLLLLASTAWLVSGALADHVGDYGYDAERRSAVIAFSAIALTLALAAGLVLLGVLRLRARGARALIAVAALVLLVVSATTDPIQGFYTSAWTTVFVVADLAVFIVGLGAVLALPPEGVPR